LSVASTVHKIAITAVALAAALTFSNVAQAETFALLAPTGADDISPATRASAIDALLVALRTSGHRPTLPAEVARQLSAAHSPACLALDCARSVISALHVNGVVETVLWSNGSGGVREVVVSIVRAGGAESSGTAAVGNGDVGAAARAALTQALSSAGTAAPPVRVTVRVSPRGAALTLDGRPLGQAPWQGLLPTGQHVLVAGHVGFLIERRELDLRSGPVELAMELARDPDADADADADGNADDGTADDRAARGGGGQNSSGRAVVGPIVLGAVGIALLGFDVAALVYAGGEPPVGIERSLDPLPFVLYGAAGIGALTGALLWWLLSGGGDSNDGASSDGASRDGASSSSRQFRVALDLRGASLALTF